MNILKVKELIEQLKKYDGKTKVMLDIDYKWSNYSSHIEDVYEDFYVGTDGRTTSDKCIYIQSEI